MKICHNCNIEIDWEDNHHINGAIYGCEFCQNYICFKCLKEFNINFDIFSDDIKCEECND